MAFKKGISGNPQGRPVGATSKIGKPVKELLSDFINRKVLELPSIWMKLSAKDQSVLLKDLFPYFMPKMEATSVNLNVSKLSDEEVTELIERLFKTKKNA